MLKSVLVLCGMMLVHCCHGGPSARRHRRHLFNLRHKEKDIFFGMMSLARESEEIARLLASNIIGVQTKLHTFECPELKASSVVPTSVHALRPGDIKAVGAIGDSLTAGRGAKDGVIGLLSDFRGVSWSGGGDLDYEHYITLPNILKKYNRNLYGFATGVGDFRKNFNVAVTGAKAYEGLDQAIDLVQSMKSSRSIDFENDWKLVTIFLGANDLCDWCEDEERFHQENYRNHLMDTLDHLYDNLPRAFINLVLVVNVEMASQLARGLVCDAVHQFACDCASNPSDEVAVWRLRRLRENYQSVTKELVYSGRYDGREDFTVEIQPFYEHSGLPMKEDSDDIDYDYFGADCFHYSVMGHEAVAVALWNNMFEPEGNKSLEWKQELALICPTEDNPYLCTRLNSYNKKK